MEQHGVLMLQRRPKKDEERRFGAATPNRILVYPGQTVSKLCPASHWGAGIITETGMPSGNPRSAGALPGQAFHQFLAARYIDYPFQVAGRKR
jgi:hypothetical protein